MPGALIFTFTLKELTQARDLGEESSRVRKFIVTARGGQGAVHFDWSATQDDPGAMRGEFERIALDRIHTRDAWIGLVTALVDQVETWAKEMDWSTRRVEKKIDDNWIGRHRVPALLMQAETCRILLEPVGRSAPGAEGVVDLYLMPAYDDIATLFHYENRWNLHYGSEPASNAADIREAPAIPLSKEALHGVLEEMKQHAA